MFSKIKNALRTGALLLGALLSAVIPAVTDAHRGRGMPITQTGWTAGQQPLGLNLIEVPYSNGQQPFLNAFKNGGGQPEPWIGTMTYNHNYVPYIGWATADCTNPATCTSYTNTHEESYLQVDGSQYVTSFTASPTPSGGQVFNAVYATLLNSISKPTGATQYYQAGYYTLSFEGSCTLIVNQDATGLSSPAGGLTSGMISGNVITSTMGATTSGSVQVYVPTPSSNGVRIFETAVGSGSNYCTNIAFVYTPWMSSFTYDGHTFPGYNSGQLFNPWFLDWLYQSPLNTIRFMRMLNMDAEPLNGVNGGFCLTGPVTSGATTATLGTCIQNSTGYWAIGATTITLGSAWAGTTGTYTVTWSDGEQRSVTFTNGSTTTSTFTALTNTGNQYSIAAVNYPGPVWTAPSGTWLFNFVSYGATNTLTGGSVLMSTTTGSGTVTFPSGGAPAAEPADFYVTLINNWTQRPKASDAFWNTQRGVPYDVAGNLCNIVNQGNGSNCWINVPHAANSIPGYASGLANLFYNGTGDTSGQFSAGLNAANKLILEIGNEDWNGSSTNGQYAIAQGYTVFGSDYTAGYSWRGSQILILGQAFATVYGSSYGARVAPTFAAQYGYGGGGDAINVIEAHDYVLLGNTAPWDVTQYGGAHSSSNPWIVSSVAIAPYSGLSSYMCATDFTELQAQSDGGLTMFFAAQSANPVYDARTGMNYSFSSNQGCSTALPSGGWNAVNVAQVQANQTGINSVTTTTRTIPITYYEQGFGFYGSSSYAAQQAFYVSVLADARAVTMMENYFTAINGANSGGTSCQFDFASYNGNNGNFGLIQGVNQSNTPSVLSSTPYPWQGFIGSTL